ncbi:MAG: S-methyl-5-thioribose-1-phosphate isomerase [Chloroflexota bacterium]
MSAFRSIEWLEGGIVRMLDQRKLPLETTYNDYTTYQDVAQAITDMVIRGAPAIGAAAAYGIALTAHHSAAADLDSLYDELEVADQLLRKSRPTAVNLFWALDRMVAHIANFKVSTENGSISQLQSATLSEAHAIAAEDVELNRAIGKHAMPLIPDKATIIHHCNTGSLATVDYGTALGIIRMAHEEGKQVMALIDETRPRLQGGRLSAYELKAQGVPFKVIVDGASGHFLRTGDVNLCVVGADRVVANGDTANKIGTYNLAVVARENNIPFYVAAPTTTIDMATATGDEIEIEERPAHEVTHVDASQITPDDVAVANPAFDVTPAKYITAIITERGVVYPPFEENIARIMREK